MSDGKCVNCGREWKYHFNEYCNDNDCYLRKIVPRNKTYITDDSMDDESYVNMDEMCANCGCTYGEHFGPYRKPEAYCRQEDYLKEDRSRVSKLKQFAHEKPLWMMDRNQTPVAVGDKVAFILTSGWTEGTVVKIFLNSSVFRIESGDKYERFREHVESRCEEQ